MKRYFFLAAMLILLGTVRSPVTHAELDDSEGDASKTVVSATYAVYSAQPLGAMRIAGESTPITLNTSGNLQFSKHLKLEVEHEGDMGWQYAVRLDEFTVRHTLAQGNIRAKIPAGYASYQVSGITSENETNGMISGAGVFASGSSQVVLEAAEGSGRGRFTADLILQVDIPDLLEVAEVNDTDRISPGERVGLLAGEYRASLTYTLVTGL
ncbi:hypothetical protein [Paenibacillus sp. FSL L8-0463]|uniref:hypothetical protein n=1 Tax=Paenibacillus sp. FSL L8-0463 TaxID=2954687 RepID=UPI0031191A64